jgi:hypothetical protein
MPYDGVIWILAAIVWYSAVLYGGWPDNYTFGLKGIKNDASKGHTGPFASIQTQHEREER